MDDELTITKPMSISACGRYFAITSLTGQLNVWDTITADIVAQYIPSKHLLTNCTRISWPNNYHDHQIIINNNNQKQINGTSNNNDNRINELHKLKLLALGTENGTIFIFSVHKNELYSTYSNNNNNNKLNIDGHSERINDLCWSKKSIDTLFSCSQDKYVIEWNIIESKIKCKTILEHNSVITSICVIDNDNYIITGSNQLKLWNWPKKQLLKIFNGHSNEINFLRTIKFKNDDNDDGDIDYYVLSSAILDRYINLWKLDMDQSLNNKPTNSFATFLLDDEPISLEIANNFNSGLLYVLSVSKSGQFHMFEEMIDKLSNKKQLKPIKSKYCLNIQIQNSHNNNNNNNNLKRLKHQIPYLYAYIDSDQLIRKSLINCNNNNTNNGNINKKYNQSSQMDDKNRIHIQTIYGTSNRPIFERLSIYECEKLCQEQNKNNKNNYATIIKDSSILNSLNLLPKPLIENFSTEQNTKIKYSKSNNLTMIGPVGMVAQQPLYNGVINGVDHDDNEKMDIDMDNVKDLNINDSNNNKLNEILDSNNNNNEINNDDNNKNNKNDNDNDKKIKKSKELSFDEQLKQIENNTIRLKKQNKLQHHQQQQQSKQQIVGTDSLVSVLIQGLQSNDTNMLSTVFQTNHSDSIIINTIKKLPIQYLSKLLNQLQKGLLLQQQQSQEQNITKTSKKTTALSYNEQYSIYLKWITFLLRNRFSYLMTIPNSANKFLPLKQLIQAKTASLEKCYQLKGRLDLILSQAKLDDTQDTTRLSFTKPKMTYESESSDDEEEEDDEENDDVDDDIDRMSIDDKDLMEDDSENDDDDDEDDEDDNKIILEQQNDELSNDDESDEESSDDDDNDELTNEIEDSEDEDDKEVIVEPKKSSSTVKRKRKISNDEDED